MKDMLVERESVGLKNMYWEFNVSGGETDTKQRRRATYRERKQTKGKGERESKRNRELFQNVVGLIYGGHGKLRRGTRRKRRREEGGENGKEE